MRLLAVLALSACSFIGVRGHSTPVTSEEPVECTDSYEAPAADTIFAGVAAVAILNATPCNEAGADCYWANALGLAGVLGALVYTPSAIYGYKTVTDCDRAQEEQRAFWRATDPVAK